MKTKSIIKYFASIVAILILVTSCNSGSTNTENNNQSNAQPSDTSSEQAVVKSDSNDDGYVIGFTNSYNGNSYRQQLEKYMIEAAEELKETGELKELIISEANQNNNTQVQQIQSFILQGVDAIIIDPGSATALNGAIQEASDAGIPTIIINDGPVTSDAELCYQINYDTVDQMSYLTEYIAEAIGGKGNIIELRGTAGSEFDNLAHKGVEETLKKYPEINVVSEIYTDWTGSKAQFELANVLPTLDNIDAVVTQGGDSYAAVQAFEAAGKEIPVIGGDNRGYFINWWANEAPDDYNTISVSSNPWDGATGIYVAVEILNGTEVPKETIHPFAVIKKEEVMDHANVEPESIVTPTYDRQWVIDNIINQ